MKESPSDAGWLEARIEQWRHGPGRSRTVGSADVVDLERQLRGHISALTAAGLADDEAFLVAVKRTEALDPTAHDSTARASARRTDAIVAVALAVAAATAIKIPALFGWQIDEHRPADLGFYFRNLSLFALPFLAGYFVWKRRLAASTSWGLAGAFVGAIVFANVYPFATAGSTEGLTAIHVPIVLSLLVGIAYAGGRWSEVEGRMDFIRFTGEAFIYYVLIALGGGVFTACFAVIFLAIGIDVGPFIESWLLPCGAAGGVLVAAWLVEAKQGVLEHMAPVLTRLFTPLFAAMLLVFLGTVLWTGRGVALDIQREVLIAFDLLLVVVLGLLLYSISARNRAAPPAVSDLLQVVLLAGALLTDAVALWAIATRITEFGFSPNRVAALGENVILLVNLTWSAVRYIRFLRGRGTFIDLERLQTGYVPVYAAWAAFVVIAFPPMFGYL